MREVFYEETANIEKYSSARTKYNILSIISLVSFALAIIFAMLVYMFFDWSKGNVLVSVIVILVILILLIGLGIFVGFLKNKFCVEYDYTFISGEIRVAKVVKNIKRRSLTSFDCSDILKIGVYNSEEYKKIKSDSSIDEKILSSNENAQDNKGFYYILVGKNGTKTIYIFECTKTFLLNVIRFSNKNVLDKDLLWFI